MSNPKWEIGPVKLTGGHEAIIDAINDGQDDYRYSGRVRGQRGIMVSVGWHANGRYMYHDTDQGYSLAPPPKKTVLTKTVWMVVRDNGELELFYKQKTARDVFDGLKAFAIRKIDPFEVTEGEGL